MGCGLERPVNKLHRFYTSPGAEFLLGSAEIAFPPISKTLHFSGSMVPPVRIELTTPPLPRACSTPELRRHNSRGAPCHRAAIDATGMGRGSGTWCQNFAMIRPGRARPPLTFRRRRCTMRAVEFDGREGRLMTAGDKGGRPRGGLGAPRRGDLKRARQAAALRQNLHRRKQQDRLRSPAHTPSNKDDRA